MISRYHGGAFVVFSKALNPNMTVLAVAGSFASVIGGAPAAAVVFAGEVDARTAKDPRVADLQARVAAATGGERAALLTQLVDVRSAVRAQKLGEVATEFDRVHSIQRAVEVGSVDAIIRPEELRPQIIAAIERGLAGGNAGGTAVRPRDGGVLESGDLAVGAGSAADLFGLAAEQDLASGGRPDGWPPSNA